MRVTNGMIVNTTLAGLNTNMTKMNKNYSQMVTGKKIQRVSDDPIIAGRALKLKGNVRQNTQFDSNTKEAASWMEVTESSLSNMTEILKDIRTKAVQAATGTLTEDDKQTIKNDMEQLWAQMQEEANATYGGRNIFTGFKTNEPMMLTEDVTITQDYLDSMGLTPTPTNLELQADLTLSKESTMAAGTVLKEGTVLGKGSIIATGTTIEEMTIGVGSELNQVDFQAATGITIAGTNPAQMTIGNPITLAKGSKITKDSYDELVAADPNFDGQVGADGQTIFKELTDSEGNVSGYEMLADATFAGGTVSTETAKDVVGFEHLGNGQFRTTKPINAKQVTLTGEMKAGAETILKKDTTLAGISKLGIYSKLAKESTLEPGSTIGKGTMNPKVKGNIANQSIEYEIGVNTTVRVNTTGMDTFLSKVEATLTDIFITMDATKNDENITNSDLHEMFTNKLGELDDLINDISEKTADVGSRMNRIEYTQERLADNKITLTELLSNTEDIDAEEAYINFNVQYAAYQSALQATSKIIMNTLADYL